MNGTVGRLQRVHGVAEEGDGRGHHQHHRDVQERLDRQLPTEAEDQPRDDGERDEAEDEAGEDVDAEAVPNESSAW